jgi:hypothetical protein
MKVKSVKKLTERLLQCDINTETANFYVADKSENFYLVHNSPAIIVGRDETGKFHFGDKYAKQMLSTAEEVYNYYTRTSQTDSRKQFAQEMAELCPVYEQATPQNFRGFLEAGLMYKSTPPLNDEGEYHFMPNTVEYFVQQDTPLGKRIGKSISGAAATGFFDKLPEMGGKRSPVGDTYKAFNNTGALVIIPPKFTEEGSPVDIERLRTIGRYAASNAQQIEAFLAPETGLSDIRSIIYSYVNSQVDNPQNLDRLGHNFAQWVESNPKLSAAKKLKLQQKMTDNARGASAVFKLTQAIMHLKDGIIGHKEEDTLGSMGITARLKTGEKGGEGFVHDPDAGEGPTKLVNRGGFTRANRLREANEQGKTAVVGWGRGMGHKGHMVLALAVIEYAKKIGGTPFFFVSETVGKDDPLLPGEKLAIYQLVFQEHKGIFKTAQTIIPALEEVSAKGFDNLVFIVGADQKNSFKFLAGTNKTGNKNVPFDTVKVMSRQDVAEELGMPELAIEGPRATPMRDILKDRQATTEQKFKYWRDAMPKALTDEQVMAVMRTAAERMKVPIEDNLQEADQPPQGSLYSPLSATTRDKPAPDPKAAMRHRREAKRMRRFMGHID